MFKRSLVGTVFLVALAICDTAAAKEPPYFTLHELGHNVWAAVAVPGSGAGSNSGFIVGDAGVAVVDTFQNEEAAKALLAEIRKHTDQPVRYVINTHYHLDHVTGNNVFHQAGATILAQTNVRAWERTENLKFFGKDITPAQKNWVTRLGLPDVTYDKAIDLYLGKRHLLIRSMPGHTGSDSVVVVPEADVVFTGDLFWNHTLPNTIDASTDLWIGSDDRLLAQHPTATFVAGHGEVGHAKALRAFRDYLKTLRLDVARARDDGKRGEALVAAVEPELKADYGDWDWFDHFADRNIRQTAEEFAGTKRLPGGS
ncbi:MAG: MBL fold metallo-hydrolase [Gammaproteobacteria bacterium]|jgi:glyoxylase-like metal-dependent hydrolase (beta-lactamase superfamily II)